MKIVSCGLFFISCGAALAAGDPTSLTSSPAPSTGQPWEWGEFSFLGGLFDAHPNIDVMIVTETTNVGRRAPDASPDRPVYYSGADGGLTKLGDPIGGEHPPKPKDLENLMVKSLHEGGFLPATSGHPPTVYIYYSWGSFNGYRTTGRYRDDDWDFQSWRNLMERAALVGGTKFAADWDTARMFNYYDEFTSSSARISYLTAIARGDLYFLVATACDYQAAVRGKLVILWQTRLSAEARVVSMGEALPQMVASAGPYIGHQTDGPVRLNRPAFMEGNVEIGVPVEVRDDLASNAPSPFRPVRRILPAAPWQAAN
jgi:hypothetical protein